MESRCSDNERRLEVGVDDQRGQSVVFAHLVLLRVDQLGQQLVEVDSAVCLACPLVVQLVLQLFLEAHYHVQSITSLHLEDEMVGAAGRLSHGNGAAKNALGVQVGLVNHSLDVHSLVVVRCAFGWGVALNENLGFLRRLLVQLEEKQL